MTSARTTLVVRRTLQMVAVGVGLFCTTLPVHADLLDQIKQRGEIVIATEARLPPFEFVENGKIVGYDADLMAAVMLKLPGVKINQLDLPWQGILAGLDAKKFDYVITAVTATKERVQRYAMSLPLIRFCRLREARR